jgi:superfamily II DNA or RNA helicase
LDGDEIGLIGDGHKQIGTKLTIAIINTLRKMTSEVIPKTGFLIIDECHKVASRTFNETISQFDCKYMLGLTATPERTDNLTPLIHLYLGPLVYKKGDVEAQGEGLIMKPTIWTRKTGTNYTYQDDYQSMITALINNNDRNQMIVDDIWEAVSKNRQVLVVSDRKDHCGLLADLVATKEGVIVGMLIGTVAQKKRQEIIKDLNAGVINVLIATTQLIGEGFDCQNLSTIFLTTPIRSKTKLKQTIGRILRQKEGKLDPIVCDYVDEPGVLQASYQARVSVYNEIEAKFF